MLTETEDHQTKETEEAGQFFDTEGLKDDLKGRSVRGGTVTMASQGVRFALQTGSAIAVVAGTTRLAAAWFVSSEKDHRPIINLVLGRLRKFVIRLSPVREWVERDHGWCCDVGLLPCWRRRLHGFADREAFFASMLARFVFSWGVLIWRLRDGFKQL